MIQDATGKFSSRCVLPDRSSLALVIEKWLLRWKHWPKTPAALPRRRMDREPHIGEYDPKTNAIGGSSQTPAGLNVGPKGLAQRLPSQRPLCYWPCSLSTWLQATLNLGRCS